jgi:hypothetical protein
MPRYMIARWNIRVKHAYSGLLWVGGPQVDPGYVGHLFCPIYNLSDKPVKLHVGDHIALIDFVKTTHFDPAKPETELKKYPFPPKRLFIEEYGIDDLRSALFTTAGQKLAEFEERINNVEYRFLVFTQLSFAIFALVIALVALISRVNAESIALSAGVWGALTVGLSITAFLIAIFSYVRGRIGRLVYEQYGRVMGERAKSAQRFLRRSWWVGMTVSMLVAIAGGWGMYLMAEPTLRDLRQQRVLLKSDLEGLTEKVSTNINLLSDRVERIERRPTIGPADLEKLKAELERVFEAKKPANP